MNKIRIIIIGIITLATISFTAYMYGGYRAKDRIAKLEEAIHTLDLCLQEVIKQDITYADFSLPDIDLLSSDNTEHRLSDILTEEKMIIYLPDIQCNACSAGEIELIHRIFPVDKRKGIIVIAKFNNRRELKLFEDHSKLTVYGVGVDEHFPSADLKWKTVTFLASPELKGYSFFISSPLLSKISPIYYQTALRRV